MPTPAEEESTALSRAETFYSDYPGGQLYWQRWSAESNTDALPIVLLHGGFGSWNHWLRNISELRRDRDVWTLDLPGLGESGDMPEPHTTLHFAQLVLSGIDQLLGSQTRFEIAGFSFGAMIAGQVSVLTDERCARCILIGGVGFGSLQVRVSLLAVPDVGMPAGQAEDVHRENLQRLMLYGPEAIDALAVHIHGTNLGRFRFNSRGLAASNELAELLPRIKAKLVGLWGQEDATAGGLEAIEARRNLFQQAQPDAEFHILPGIGHWAMYEAPHPVNQILHSYLPGE